MKLDRSVPPPLLSTPLNFRKPTELVLSNGIPLYVIDAQDFGAVRIDFVFSAGQWHQCLKLQSLFACRMLREGCRGYTADEFAERLDFYGAWIELSVSINRSFVTLYTLKKHFDATIALVHRMLTEPSYCEEQFQTVRNNNKAQFIVNLQKSDVVAMRALRHSIYGHQHPCGKSSNPEDYDILQIADVKDYYHRYYGSRTCQIYLSGNIDEPLLARVEELFGSAEWGHGNIPQTTDYELLPDANRTQRISLPHVVQESIRLGAPLMDISSPDFLSMRVLTAVLGGYFGSRLMKRVREEMGYTYHIGSDLITNTSQTLLLIHCEAQLGKSRDVINEVTREMLRLHTELVPDDELRMVRNYMIGEICRNYENVFSLTDAYIFMNHLGLPMSHIEQTIEAIHTTDAVSLRQLAQRYLVPDKLHTVVVGA